MVDNIINALKTQFLNPFQEDIDKSKLFNLVSECPVDDEISKSLLSLQDNGIQAMESFETSSKRKAKELAFQRDILGILVAHSCQYKSRIDIDVVLQYPLAPVSVPLSTPDGAIRKTVKSKLFNAAMSDLLVVPKESLPGQDTLNTYFLDVAAAVRSIVGKPDTIRELATRILQMVPPQYTKVFLVCDTYQQNSIKAGQREARGVSNQYFLASPAYCNHEEGCSSLCS